MPDILIRGMEMPKHCMGCPCMVDKYGGDNCCLQSEESNEKITSWDDMKAGCPLIELPPHVDLISKQTVLAALYSDYAYAAMDVIEEVPVIVPAERREDGN